MPICSQGGESEITVVQRRRGHSEPCGSSMPEDTPINIQRHRPRTHPNHATPSRFAVFAASYASGFYAQIEENSRMSRRGERRRARCTPSPTPSPNSHMGINHHVPSAGAERREHA